MKEQIKEALEQIRPFLQRDGGDVQFIDFTENGIVKVQLEGHCAGCPHAQMTVKNGIESFLKEQFAEVKSVEAVNQYQF
ncbi:MAG: NifU family protein [Clostridia bacterium]|nr:NifU family protein [Clostridia bacterium]